MGDWTLLDSDTKYGGTCRARGGHVKTTEKALSELGAGNLVGGEGYIGCMKKYLA